MTFQEMQVELQESIGSTTADRLDHIKKAINVAYREMCAFSPNSWQRDVKDITVVAGTADYDLDAACRKVLRVRPAVTTTGKIDVVTNDAWNNLVTDYDRAGTPEIARVIDLGTSNEMKIEFHPIPEAGDAGTYKYDGEFLPSDMSANSDTPIFGAQWDACLMDGARYELYKTLNHSPDKVQMMQQAYQTRFQQFLADIQRSGADTKGV